MSRAYRFMIVDVFTETALAGNQLAVFSNATGMPEETMQALAREMGFSETTFVLPPEAGGDLRMRIFTPARELPFAGHPTLGTAFALAGPLQSSLIRIETVAGIIPVALEREGAKVVFGRMEQSLPTVAPFAATRQLLEALGIEGSALPVEVYDNGVQHVFVAVGTFAEVAAVRSDLQRLESVLGETGANVFAVDGQRVKTRVFFPEIGMVEDAATGSAAGPLAVHLARHDVVPWGQMITISQGEEIGRPSTLYAWAHGSSSGVERVEVGGSALVVGRGEFLA
jgi:trans-2,3-dihydro-3-hydroxyanthranilate isomerase